MKKKLLENERKIWTGMRPFNKRNLPKGSMSYLLEQIRRPVQYTINEQSATHQHLEK
tara:strand:- start:605 stop:775 length:171 start_codon:yes stop_codon:yes gene_type:complete